MSAIAGIFDLPVDPRIIEKMLQTMKRRGPDGEGIYQSCNTLLLQTKLGKQSSEPVRIDRAGESYVLIWNGEIYNRAELSRELRIEESSDTDGQLLLQAYARWGEEMLFKLNGVFTFALWEKKKKRLFIARDRMGVKPLFYKEHAEGLLFASEIKTLLAYPTVEPELDADGIGQLLLLGPGRIPGSGVFKDIRELEPGCYGIYENGKLRIKRYWKLTDREHREDFEATSEKVRELVLDAIRLQMEVDGSMGCFLSGGLDSSLISSVCARELALKGQKLDTFSVDYLDNDKYFQAGMFQPNSDPEYIRAMVQALDSRHYWTVLSPEDLTAAIEDTTIARDLPGMADVDASLNLFCKQVKTHVPIAMSGECADEIFGGYPWYRDPQIRNFNGFPWAQTTDERKEFLAPWLREKLEPERFVMERYQQTLAECDILPGNNALDHRIKQLVNLNFRWFMQTLIDRNDRMSAGHGLQVRVPLCDYRIAEYLYGVPWEMKDYGGREKGLLRHAMQGYLPDQVLYRKKSPYPKTHHPQYLQLVSGLLREVLEDEKAPIFRIVSKEALQKLLLTDFTWPWYGQLMRRPQTIVYMLQINFWMKHYSVRIV